MKRAELAAGIRRWPSTEARHWIERFVADSAQDPRMLTIVAYGSTVREVAESGDIDLLYVFSHDAPLPIDPPFDVDVRGFRVDTVDQEIASGDEVLGWSLRHGVPLLDTDGYWSRLRDDWAARLPTPSASAAEERARRALKVAEGLAAGGDEDAAADLRLTGLTQRARARLIRSGVFPLSRPELPRQLTGIRETTLASELASLLSMRR
jgi:hypothetical protein